MPFPKVADFLSKSNVISAFASTYREFKNASRAVSDLEESSPSEQPPPQYSEVANDHQNEKPYPREGPPIPKLPPLPLATIPPQSYYVLYPHHAMSMREISLEKNQRVTISHSSRGWCYVETLSGAKGWAPRRYLKACSTVSAPRDPYYRQVLYDFVAQDETQNTLRAQDSVFVINRESGFCRVREGSRIGWAPAVCIDGEAFQETGPNLFSKEQQYRVMDDCVAQGHSRIELKKNDLVTIISKGIGSKGRLWLVKNSSGNTGLAVSALLQTVAPSLFTAAPVTEYQYQTTKRRAPRPESCIGMTALSVPKWQWTNVQCRFWLAAVFESYLGMNQTKAKEQADKFKGFGPLLFGLNEKGWKNWLGEHEGYSMFAMILDMKSRPGALPGTMIMGPTQIGQELGA